MKSNYKRLGDYIQLVDVRNTDMTVNRLLGININKQFMPSVANISNTDLSKYKIINKEMFACNVMHVGRDEKIPIAFYTDEEPAIISPAYLVFLISNNGLLPEFLMMQLKRHEFDRYAWYICDSSIRGGLEWERFCDIQIPIPDIEVQRHYVTLYKALQKNQQAYKKSLDDLQLISNTIFESLVNKVTHKRIGDYIQLVDVRNRDMAVNRLLGININKQFITSAANVSRTDLSKYKTIRKGQFAYSAMQVGRDETIRVALYNLDEPAIISPAYLVFKVNDKQEIFSEYLMAWFQRLESDRYGWFISDSSVRASLEWERFCDIEIPIPSIEVQESIVAIHHTLETRKRLNNELKAQIQNLCPILMRGVAENLV